jgi:hypothetical protein
MEYAEEKYFVHFLIKLGFSECTQTLTAKLCTNSLVEITALFYDKDKSVNAV